MWRMDGKDAVCSINRRGGDVFKLFFFFFKNIFSFLLYWAFFFFLFLPFLFLVQLLRISSGFCETLERFEGDVVDLVLILNLESGDDIIEFFSDVM